MTTVKVPAIPGPRRRLCYAPQPLGEGMFRCDRVEGHGGRHSWEGQAVPAPLRERLEAPDADGIVYRIEVFIENDGQYAAEFTNGTGRVGGMGDYSATPVGALANLCATLIHILEDEAFDTKGREEE